MRTARDDAAHYRHRTRVRVGGLTGPKGRLLKCERRDGSGTYWKVKLDSGEWVWPRDLVIDGPGDRIAQCGDCELPFITDGTSPLCPGCDAAAFGSAEDRADETRFDRVRWRSEERGHGHRR